MHGQGTDRCAAAWHMRASNSPRAVDRDMGRVCLGRPLQGLRNGKLPTEAISTEDSAYPDRDQIEHKHRRVTLLGSLLIVKLYQSKH